MSDNRIYGLTQQSLIFYSCHSLIGSTGGLYSVQSLRALGHSLRSFHPLREPFCAFCASNWQAMEGKTVKGGLRSTRNPSTSVHIPLGNTQPMDPPSCKWARKWGLMVCQEREREKGDASTYENALLQPTLLITKFLFPLLSTCTTNYLSTATKGR